MSDLTTLTCQEFLSKLASNAPTPGGGGGAAMAGALAVALTSMVGNLTVGKEKFAEHEAEVQEILLQAEALRTQFLQLVNADAEVFNAFMTCYRLPKATDEEKLKRNQAIQNAAKQAAEVPLQIAEASLKVMHIAKRMAEIGNPTAITDAAVSSIMGRAALRSAVYNVIVNLKLIKDEAYNQEMYVKLDAMQNEAVALEQETLLVTNAVLG
ncbi:MAG: cyclodeaminase/cyclohydrolase family protein [Phascolarctobacterium sp.]|nr:cyclodeaminase/cyclohydrolase family protein [Phascolarctobacterium sp.]